jgi:hypothetical protein
VRDLIEEVVGNAMLKGKRRGAPEPR